MEFRETVYTKFDRETTYLRNEPRPSVRNAQGLEEFVQAAAQVINANESEISSAAQPKPS